jgi:hypothetical protein
MSGRQLSSVSRAQGSTPDPGEVRDLQRFAV